MFWFKACPKCHGDLHQDRDMYGAFIACLNCGYYLTDGQMARLIMASRPKLRKEPLPIGG